MKTLTINQLYGVGAAAAGLGILFNYLFFNHVPGISFVIYISLAFAAFFYFAKKYEINIPKEAKWFVPLILFFSAMVAFRANEVLMVFNILVTLVLLLLFSRHVAGKKIQNSVFFDFIKTAVMVPLKMLGSAFASLARMLSAQKEFAGHKKTTQVIKGLLITLPIAVIFVLLLISADAVFEKTVKNIFNFNIHFGRNFTPQLVLFLLSSLAWLGAFAYVLQNSITIEPAPLASKEPVFSLGKLEANMLFGAINFIFLTFVIIQIKYLFAGHGAVTSLGMTYAQYAHKGFGELVLVALLTFVTIFLAEKYIYKDEAGKNKAFTFLSLAVIVLVLVIIASAFTRLTVYEQAYSYTFLRVLVQAFIVWLAAVFVWLGYKLTARITEQKFVFGIFLLATTFFVMLNIVNVDALVARKNIEQFAAAGKLDSWYITSLSADAVPELIPLVDSTYTDQNGLPLSETVAIALKDFANNNKLQTWQSFNYSKWRALQLVKGQNW